jgi:hypothetical protein
MLGDWPWRQGSYHSPLRIHVREPNQFQALDPKYSFKLHASAYFVLSVLLKRCHLSLLVFAFLNPKSLINVSSTAMSLRLNCKCWQHCNTLKRWSIKNMTQFSMIYNQLQRAMPRLGRLVVGFPPRRPSFDPSASPCGDPWWIKWHCARFTSVVPWLHTRTFNCHRPSSHSYVQLSPTLHNLRIRT